VALVRTFSVVPVDEVVAKRVRINTSCSISDQRSSDRKPGVTVKRVKAELDNVVDVCVGCGAGCCEATPGFSSPRPCCSRWSLRLKLLCAGHASIRVPSIVKCSSDSLAASLQCQSENPSVTSTASSSSRDPSSYARSGCSVDESAEREM
jgi:hypothetical protein